jgi:hypothetical protein
MAGEILPNVDAEGEQVRHRSSRRLKQKPS